MLLLATDKLCDHPLSSVQFPDAGKMEWFAAMINACEPLMDNVIGLWMEFHFQPSAPLRRTSKTQCMTVIHGTPQ